MPATPETDVTPDLFDDLLPSPESAQEALTPGALILLALARHARLLYSFGPTGAAQAGYAHFQPTACLINEYVAGAKLPLHQDKDELDLSDPSNPCRWLCPSRLAYQGVAALPGGGGMGCDFGKTSPGHL